MNKMVIAKKEVATYSSLITDTLVVDGILKVNGLLKARQMVLVYKCGHEKLNNL